MKNETIVIDVYLTYDLMKNNVFLLLLVFVLAACGERGTVTGKIEGLTNDTILVAYCPLSRLNTARPQDTVVAVDGKFSYGRVFDVPTQVMFYPRQGFQVFAGQEYPTEATFMEFYLEPGQRVVVRGNIDNRRLEYDVEGSPLNRVMADDRMQMLGMIERADSLAKETVRLWADGASQEVTSGVNRKRRALFDSVLQVRKDYILAHPRDLRSAYYMAEMPVKFFAQHFDTLAPEWKEAPVLKPLFDERLKAVTRDKLLREAMANVSVRAEAPDFTLKTDTGSDFTLSSLRGKYVVVDFWGSWCGWCIKGIPDMKTYYGKYKDRMEFVGVACRDTDKSWRKALEEHEMPWTQVINDKKKAEEDVAVLYGVTTYPTKVVIDPDGKVVARVQGESREFYQKVDSLMAK